MDNIFIDMAISVILTAVKASVKNPQKKAE